MESDFLLIRFPSIPKWKSFQIKCIVGWLRWIQIQYKIQIQKIIEENRLIGFKFHLIIFIRE